MTKRNYAIIGLFTPVLFWFTYFVMSYQRTDYNFQTKAISELGALDAPNKLTWNVLGYILPGILICIYSFGLYKSVANKHNSKLPLIGLFLSGFFMAVSGFFPGDFVNRQSVTMLLHTVGSFGSFICFLIAAFSFPSIMKQTAYWKAAIKPTLIFTWLAIAFGAWPFIFDSMPGVGQRIVFFFYFLWIAFTAFRLYKQPAIHFKPTQTSVGVQ